MSTNRGSPRAVDVVILTAIPLEYEAALEVKAGASEGSSWEEEKRPNGLRVAFRPFRGKGGRPLRVALAVAGDMGANAATTALLPLVEEYKPRCVAMCGVCAGRLGKTNLGDVIAPDRLFFHDTGKKSPRDVKQDLTTYNVRYDWREELKRFDFVSRFRNEEWWNNRPVPYEWQEHWALLKLYEGNEAPWQLPEFEQYCPEWSKVIAGLWESGFVQPQSAELTDLGRKRAEGFLLRYQGRFPDLSPTGSLLPFQVHVEPLGSGNQVIEDPAYWGEISKYMRKALGLEMEAAAVGALAYSQPHLKLDALVMKAVMDFGNEGRDDQFKSFAARVSAECLIAFLLEHLDVEVVPGVDDILMAVGISEPHRNAPPSALLNARYEIVPFHGREETLEGLDRWSEEETPVGVRLLYADGGVGKTRLAIEWVRRRARSGWVSGFLPKDTPERWLERLWGLGQPVLIVVDYAESHPDLRGLLLRLRQFSEQEGKGRLRRMRLLLLARNAGDWWQFLRSDARLGAWLGAGEELPPLAVNEAERAQVFQEAVERFAVKLGKSNVRGVQGLSLGDERFKRVLYLHMAALARVEGLPFEANTLMDVILDHEEHFWEVQARQPSAQFAAQVALARQVIAAATLRGGVPTKEDAEAVLCRLLGRPIFGEEDALLRLLNWVYQRIGDAPAVFLPPLEPDLLGEGMVLRVAAPSRPAGERVPSNWITRVFSPDESLQCVGAGMEVLGRASATQPEVVRPWIEQLLAGPLLRKRARLALESAKAVGLRTAFSVLGDVLAERLEAEGDAALAQEMEDAGIPYPTVSLRRVAEWTDRARLKSLPTSRDDLALAEQARLLNKQGVTLIQSGRRQEALKATEEAVRLYQELANRNPDAFEADLATSLNNVGNILSELGQREAALKAAEDAVEIYRRLAERNASAFQPDLAMVLTNLGNKLGELGRREEALKATEEAVELYRRLAKLNADEYQYKLAISLHNLSPVLNDLGRKEAALAAIEEAVGIYRKLAERNADAVQANLAGSLLSWGNRLNGLSRREEALKAIQDAVGLFRRLVERNADAHHPHLAQSLNSLAAVLGGLNRYSDALEAVEESVSLYRRLIARNAAYLLDLAMSLNTLSNMLFDLDRQDEALGSVMEAVEILRRLAKRNASAYQDKLATCLNNMGRMLYGMDRLEEALVCLTEAINKIWPYFERLPISFAPVTGLILYHARKIYGALRRTLPAETGERIAIFERVTQSRLESISDSA